MKENLRDCVEAGSKEGACLVSPPKSQTPNPFPEVRDNIGKRGDQGDSEEDLEQRPKTRKYSLSTTAFLGSENHKTA